jgi:hypothetical protein
MSKGELKKMKIIAYKKADYSDSSQDGQPFEALINPESYQVEYKIEYNSEQGQGASSAQLGYKHTKPEDISFEFLFDATGTVQSGNAFLPPKQDITEDLQRFKDMLTAYEGEIHQPRYLKLIWGTMLFKGRMSTLQIQFKLFKPDGRPIRAVAKASFKGSIEENFRVALENAQSPDVTHLRMVMAGDTLPLMCYQIYGDSKYYLEVAKANGLNDFRSLQAGDELIFPPIEKASA